MSGKESYDSLDNIILALKLNYDYGVLRGSVVQCLTLNPGVLSPSCTGSPRFFVGVSLGKKFQISSLVLVKP